MLAHSAITKNLAPPHWKNKKEKNMSVFNSKFDWTNYEGVIIIINHYPLVCVECDRKSQRTHLSSEFHILW